MVAVPLQTGVEVVEEKLFWIIIRGAEKINMQAGESHIFFRPLHKFRKHFDLSY